MNMSNELSFICTSQTQHAHSKNVRELREVRTTSELSIGDSYVIIYLHSSFYDEDCNRKLFYEYIYTKYPRTLCTSSRSKLSPLVFYSV